MALLGPDHAVELPAVLEQSRVGGRMERLPAREEGAAVEARHPDFVLLDDEDRAGCQAHQTVGRAADDALVELRMAHEADHEEIDTVRPDKLHYRRHDVAGHDVRLELDTLAFR